VFCRLEAVQTAPEAFLADLHDRLGLGRPPPFRPVQRRLGTRFKPAVDTRPPTPDAFPTGDLGHMRGAIDLGQEAGLGYRYD
jgi:hypothetical protein